MGSIIAGRKPVMEALKAGTKIEKVVFLVGVQGRVIQEIRDLARSHAVECAEASRQAFRELADDVTTQGVLAVIQAKQLITLGDLLDRVHSTHQNGFFLVCDEIEDPHNLGALIRTAECAGANGVILPKHHSAPVTSTVIKASAGATEHVPVAEVTNIVQALTTLKEAAYWIVGLAAEGDRPYTAIDYSGPIAIVVGNEGRGIRRLVREHCDFLALIPLYGKIGSLNASVAGALVMFEVARQRSART